MGDEQHHKIREGREEMEAFTIMGFTFGIMGMSFGIIGFTLVTTANSKISVLEKRVEELLERSNN